MKLRSKIFCLGFLSTMTITLASCSNNNQLTAPTNLKCVDSILTWDAVANATDYELKIDDGEIITTPSILYEGLGKKKSFDVELTAIDSTGTYSKSETTKMSFKTFDTPKNLRLEDGVFVWDPIEGCESYELFDYNSNDYVVVQENKYTSYKGNSQKIKVRALGDTKGNITSNFSDYFTFKNLLPPEKIYYDYTLNKIVFDDVNDATSYELIVDEVAHKITKTDRTFDINPKDFDKHSVKVRSISDKKDTANSFFTKKIFVQKLEIKDEYVDLELPRPDDRTTGTLRISTNRNAVESIVFKCNEQEEMKSYVNSYRFDILNNKNTFELTFLPFNHSVKDKDGDEVFYLKSDVYKGSFYNLATPTNFYVSDDNKFATWDPVEGATSYKVVVTKDPEFEEEIIEREYIVKENKIEKEKIPFDRAFHTGRLKVQALGTKDSLDINSQFSDYQLYLNPFDTNNLYINDKEIKVNLEYSSGNAIYEVNGVEHAGSTFDFTNTDIFGKDIKVRAKLLAGKDRLGQIHFGTDYSDYYKLTGLPQIKNFKIDEKGVASWSGDYSNDILFKISNDLGEITKTTDNFIDLSSESNWFIKNHNLYITAIEGRPGAEPNGKVYYLGSTPYKFENVIGIETPKNVKKYNDHIGWDAVPNASKYEVKINEKIYTTDTNKFVPKTEDLEYINKVHVRAIQNKTDENSTYLYSEWTPKIEFSCTRHALYGYFEKIGNKQLKWVFEKDMPNHKYKYCINGVEGIADTNFIIIPESEEGTYELVAYRITNTLDYYWLKETKTYFLSKTPNLTTKLEGNKVILNWDSCKRAIGYELYINIYNQDDGQKAYDDYIDFRANEYTTTYEVKLDRFYYEFKIRSYCKDENNRGENHGNCSPSIWIGRDK